MLWFLLWRRSAARRSGYWTAGRIVAWFILLAFIIGFWQYAVPVIVVLVALALITGRQDQHKRSGSTRHHAVKQPPPWPGDQR